MKKSYDESFDWSGFDAGLDASDARDDALDIKKMQDKYKTSYHPGDWIKTIGSLFGTIGAALAPATEGASAFIGSGIAGGTNAIGDAINKRLDDEETDKENAELDKRKLERSQSATNQAYGMSLRNSGI